MDCLRDLQDTFNNLDNKNIRGAALVASAKYDNIKAARGNAKLAGYNQKEVSAPVEKFEGTPVNVLSMDDFKDVMNHVDKKYGDRDTIPEVNPIRERMNNLGYRNNNQGQQQER
jgi:hypothetical protein